MPKFKVLLRQDVAEYCDVIVEAEDSNEAETIAESGYYGPDDDQPLLLPFVACDLNDFERQAVECEQVPDETPVSAYKEPESECNCELCGKAVDLAADIFKMDEGENSEAYICKDCWSLRAKSKQPEAVTHPINEERADRARLALESYQAIPGMTQDTQTSAIDLIADILHFLALERIDPAQTVKLAQMNFEDEAAGD